MADGFVAGARAIEFAGKQNDFVDQHAPPFEIALSEKTSAQLTIAGHVAANTSDGNMRTKATVFAAKSEFAQSLLDIIVQDDHLLCPFARSDPNRSWPRC